MYIRDTMMAMNIDHGNDNVCLYFIVKHHCAMPYIDCARRLAY